MNNSKWSASLIISILLAFTWIPQLAAQEISSPDVDRIDCNNEGRAVVSLIGTNFEPDGIYISWHGLVDPPIRIWEANGDATATALLPEDVEGIDVDFMWTAGDDPVFRLFPVPTCDAAEFLCNGLAVTVELSKGETPTDGDDVIRGTSGDDTINARGGNDIICALQGDDVVDGGDGVDKVFAGKGDDTIIGGTGNDLLIGGPGIDTISGGNGNDRIQGGDGADELSGGNGKDRIAGGNGNDILRGGKFDDRLFGNLGRDQLFGDEGNDVLRGGAWKDVMNGGAGSNDGCTLTDPGGLVETRIGCEAGVFGR